MSNQPQYHSPPPSNGLGVAGFIVSLLGIFTAGILCPIGMLLSLLALFRRPRGFAFAGFIIGLIGTAVLTVILLFFFGVGFAIFSVAKPMVATEQMMGLAKGDVNAYVSTHGATPDDSTGQAIISARLDGWGHVMRYHRTSTWSYELRSAGADGVFNTGDDNANYFP